MLEREDQSGRMNYAPLNCAPIEIVEPLTQKVGVYFQFGKWNCGQNFTRASPPRKRDRGKSAKTDRVNVKTYLNDIINHLTLSIMPFANKQRIFSTAIAAGQNSPT